MVATGGFPDGIPDRCPVCRRHIAVEPSPSTGDALCPFCGTLVWPPPGELPQSRRTSVLHGFELLKKIGQNSQGPLYEARRIADNKPATIWTLSLQLALDEAIVRRFLQEAATLAQLKHPNLLDVWGTHSFGSVHFFATELFEGRSMQEVLQTANRLSLGDALHIALRCAEALEHAHRANIVHRHVEPRHILVSRSGTVKLAGFGFCMSESGMMTTSTLDGEYIAPETARNAKHVDRRTDVYGLGGTLFRFVTGRIPFSGENLIELIMAEESGCYTPARSINGDVPQRLDEILERTLASDPADRYPDCAELIAELRSLGLENRRLSFAQRGG